MKKYRFFALLLAAILALALMPPAFALDDPQPRCGAAIVVDGDHGDILYDYNAHQKMYPASITKIMTSLVVLEAVDRGQLALDTPITASAQAVRLPAGSSTAGIKAGEILTVEQLLYCDLVPSANEACNILAEAVAGSNEAFVELMNAKAKQLDMTGTHFTNPHGIHDDDHYTTAYDIYLMSAAAMEYDIFRTIVSTAVYTLPATNLSAERLFYNTNGLLSNWYVMGYIYADAIGIKTGYTEEAGRCIATAATDDQGRTFYCVILGAENTYDENGNFVRYSYAESKRMLQWAFRNFRRITLLDADTPHVIREVPVTMSDEADYVLAQPVGSIVATMPTDYNPDLAELIVDLPKSVEAPIAAGDKLGTITIVYRGVEYGTLDMVATDPVTRSQFLHNVQILQTYWAKWWVKALLALVVVLILVLILWLGVIRPRRKARRRYSYSGASRNGSRATRNSGRSGPSYRGRRR